jgi:hypothetical protein
MGVELALSQLHVQTPSPHMLTENPTEDLTEDLTDDRPKI